MTTRRDWIILLPDAAAEVIQNGGKWGTLTLRLSSPDRAATVAAVTNEGSEFVAIPLPKNHFLTTADYHPGGHWYRVSPALTALQWTLTHQMAAIPFAQFREIIPNAQPPSQDGWYVAITFCPEPLQISENRTLPNWAAWSVSTKSVYPITIDISEGTDRIAALGEVWPVNSLANKRALLLGTGSIGGATANALASYGLGQIDLVDPDRLEFHNVPRHVLDRRHVGLPKAAALADEIGRRWPDSKFSAHELDLVSQADEIRTLIALADVVICTVDGVEPRQVASYMTKRARKPIVLACVLEDGRYGEVLRIRPIPEVGCLDCQRRHLQEEGLLDLETSLDIGYGTGTRHRPMTAVGGDLHLVGTIAAKIAVATVLRERGEADQSLHRDNLVIALRPRAGLSRPFDATRMLDLRWYDAGVPYDDCRACYSR